MQKITKANNFEPLSLTDWKAANPQGNYKDLTHVERQDIRIACAIEQFYICAYCCQAISGVSGDCMNEHVEARSLAPHRSLDFTNIVASCTSANQCDDSHKSQPLLLTPFMAACETDFEFRLSGRVSGRTQQAIHAIEVLNLGDTEQNNKGLIDKRKQFISSILLDNGIDPTDGLDDDELIEMVIEDILSPTDGKLEAFAPVVANVLRNWIA
jgi:uncharacterized protein (TIGR02646 family)